MQLLNSWHWHSLGCHDWIMRAITKVCHAPDLKKNFIFLNTLNTQGYKYMSKEGTMMVTKGFLFMLKAKLEDCLYTLAESIIVGSINASTVWLSNDDNAILWHMRLDHMSAWGLEMLIKQVHQEQRFLNYRIYLELNYHVQNPNVS